MFTPRFVISAFESDDPRDRDRGERAALHLMRALVAINIDLLLDYPKLPMLYESGLKYNGQNVLKGQEDWLDYLAALATCWGGGGGKEKEKEKARAYGAGGVAQCPTGGVATDCKVLVAIRVAELRIRGVDARPYLVRQGPIRKPDGKITYAYHVIVQIVGRDGSVAFEDPSKILGMKSDLAP